MKYTSSEANKLLKKLNEDHNNLLYKENNSRSFLAAVGEDVDSVRPEYSYTETRNKLEEIEQEIRTVKHAINVFNCTTKVIGYDMTIDEALVYIPQLTSLKNKLADMMSVLPKAREENMASRSNIIDYRYANYDVEKVAEDYNEVAQQLSRIQTALDLTNNTITLEI